MKYLFLLFITVILLSCNEKQRNVRSSNANYSVIDVGSSVGKGRVVNLSEIASDINYIPLETDSSSLIGPLPFIYYENERIYVRFSRIIKVFDKEGKYLFTFDRRGGGPEEYPSSSSIEIEPGSGNFRAKFQKGGYSVVRTYSREGLFLKDFTFPEITRMSKTIKISSNLFISQFIQIEKEGKEYIGFLFDTLSKIEGYIPTPVVEKKYKTEGDNTIIIGNRRIYMSGIKIHSFLHSFKNSPRIFTLLADTIYTYNKENGVEPVYALDYGKYMNEKVVLSNITSTTGEFINISDHFYVETENFLLMNFILRDYAHEPFIGKNILNIGRMRERSDAFGLYNKKSGDFTLLNHPIKGTPGFKDDILNGLPFIPQYMSEDNFAVNLFYPDELIDYVANNQVSPEIKKIVDTLKESDNPVVALAKLK
ncbi:MAG: hypothetical protein CVU12_07260 [Bacteroidetes bacterium HGW-Bacteroidetes-7]|nr:MAG: hypothetical protein CVU12_07260 [Bacteroidetes bacterium HGW-Bacteroidetes-7]